MHFFSNLYLPAWDHSVYTSLPKVKTYSLHLVLCIPCFICYFALTANLQHFGLFLQCIHCWIIRFGLKSIALSRILLFATIFVVSMLIVSEKNSFESVFGSALVPKIPFYFFAACSCLHGTVVMKSNTACFFLFSCSRGQRKWCYRVFLFFCKLDFFRNLHETDWSEVHYI